MTALSRGAAALFTLSTLCLYGGPASAAASTRSDPAGDVRVAHTATSAQQDTVDITKVRYVVRAERLVIITTFVDLAQTPGNEFVETEVGTGGSTLTLSSEVGKKRVMIFTGSAYYACRGADSSADFTRSTVRQSVPVRCLDAAQVRLKSSAVLARANGSEIAADAVRRSGDVVLRHSMG